MDPNKALSDMLDWAKDREDPVAADIFLAIDSWLSKGGFLPDRWKRPDLSFPAVSPDLRPAFNAAKDHEINLGDL